MKKIAVIPARLQATRFPKKLLEDLGGRSVIEQTYLATVGTDLFDQVWVATDSPEIAEKIKHIGGEVFLSQIQHNCGSLPILLSMYKGMSLLSKRKAYNPS